MFESNIKYTYQFRPKCKNYSPNIAFIKRYSKKTNTMNNQFVEHNITASISSNERYKSAKVIL